MMYYHYYDQPIFELQMGLEPTAMRFRVSRSTIELLKH